MNNYKSATCPEHFHLVEQQIIQEILNGRYVISSSPPKLISALGAIPKSKPGSIRLIHDCSRPEDLALNCFATLEKFSYQTIQDAAALVTPGCYFAKVDLSAAFRSVRINPRDYPLAGLSWTFSGDDHPTWIYDTRLMFGSRRAPMIFNELSQAVCRIMNHRGLLRLTCYLDDFLISGSSVEEVSFWTLELIKLLRCLGFAVNYDKVLGPSQQLEFLGVEFDSVEGVLRLSHDKWSRLMKDVKHMLSQRSASKRELQSLAGKLNWASQIVEGGRPHLRRLLDRIKPLKGPAHRTRITTEARKDLLWWIHFAKHFNGALPITESRPICSVSIDSCDHAAGGFYNGAWFHFPWIDWPGARSQPINYKEVLALEPAAWLWGPLWANKQVFVHSDNIAAVHLINKGTSKDPFVMDSLRRIFWLSAIWNFKLRAFYYPGTQNILADAASRLHEPWALPTLQSAMHHTFLA